MMNFSQRRNALLREQYPHEAFNATDSFLDKLFDTQEWTVFRHQVRDALSWPYGKRTFAERKAVGAAALLALKTAHRERFGGCDLDDLSLRWRCRSDSESVARSIRAAGRGLLRLAKKAKKSGEYYHEPELARERRAALVDGTLIYLARHFECAADVVYEQPASPASSGECYSPGPCWRCERKWLRDD
jgi:hypothetical protein